MRNRLVTFFFAFAALALIVAPVSAYWQSRQQVIVGAAVCSQATSFISRSSITGTDATNYTDLICGLETDGVGCSTKLDALYILAAPNSTVAGLNLCSTSFSPLTVTGSPTFTTNRGYNNGSTSNYLRTGYLPNAVGNFLVQNSAMISAYVRDEASGGFVSEIGSSGGGSPIDIFSNFASIIFANVNASSGPSPASGGTGAGQVVVSRTGATTTEIYKNGSSLGTDATASVAPNGVEIYILCINSGGPFQCSDRQVAAAAIGSGMNTTQANAYAARVNTFMTAVGANVY